ncbi:MAG: hypothetical protein KAT00_12960 [Planctomycetes bacterium]|nr:hypothetical protein [Planctomycetota bacterium]
MKRQFTFMAVSAAFMLVCALPCEALVYEVGDVNQDCNVDSNDLDLILNGWLSSLGELQFDPGSDTNADDSIDVWDFAAVSQGWQLNDHVKWSEAVSKVWLLARALHTHCHYRNQDAGNITMYVLSASDLELDPGQLDGRWFSEGDFFPMEGSVFFPPGPLRFTITANRPDLVCSPAFKKFTYQNIYAETDEEIWMEGKTLAWIIAMSIREYVSHYEYHMWYFDPILEAEDLGLRRNELEGFYFTESNFAWEGSYDAQNELLDFTVTATAPAGVGSPATLQYTQETATGQNDKENWWEGERIMGTIAMLIRGYVIENQHSVADFNDLSLAELRLDLNDMTGFHFSPENFSWTGSYDEPNDILEYTITATAPDIISQPSSKTLDQDSQLWLTDMQKYLEGRAIARLIASKIREYFAQCGCSLPNFDSIALPGEIGLTGDNLTGMYFSHTGYADTDFYWTGSYDLPTDELNFVITAEKGPLIISPVKITLDQDGMWAEYP